MLETCLRETRVRLPTIVMLETWLRASMVRLAIVMVETWLRESGILRLSNFFDKLS